MADFSKIALVLLAAGRSTRFGDANKLLYPLHSKPLMLHAMETLTPLPFATHLLVGSAEICARVPQPFQTLFNPAPERGMGYSIALGVRAIEASDAQACLIALADMPFIPKTHFEALVSSASVDLPRCIIATRSDERTQVPAIFGRTHFDALKSLDGDAGARSLLINAPAIPARSEWLADFDRLADFED